MSRRCQLVIAFTVGVVLALATAAGAVSPGAITEFPVGGAPALTGITAGPDGNVWFTDGTAIGQITPAGAIRSFTPSTSGVSIQAWNAITLGPDGDLWATATILPEGGLIAQISSNGTFVHLFSADLQANADPTLITAGPSGSSTLWFIDNAVARGGTDDIGEITTGGTITEFPAPAAPDPTGLIAADGKLWLSSAPGGGGYGAIDVVNPSTGGLETEYQPGAMEPDFNPQGLTADANGNLFFTVDGGAELLTGGALRGIGEIMTPVSDPTVTVYSSGLQADNESDPTVVSLGPDGNVYFVDDGQLNGGHDAVGELNAATHAITEFSQGLSSASSPRTVTAGPDGNVWFTDQGAASIGVLDLVGSTIPAGTTTTVASTTPTGTTATTTTTTTTTSKSPPSIPPRLSHVRQARTVWVERAGVRPGARVGTTFSFTLNEAALVKLKFTVYRQGRLVHGKCVAHAPKHGVAHKCDYPAGQAGSLTHHGTAGADKVSFDGATTGAKRRLAPGDYGVVITATANGASTSSKPLEFAIEGPVVKRSV